MHASTTGYSRSARRMPHTLFLTGFLTGALVLAACGGEAAPQIPVDAGRASTSTIPFSTATAPSSTDAASAPSTVPTESTESTESPDQDDSGDAGVVGDSTTTSVAGSTPARDESATDIATETAWRNVTGNLTSVETECGNLTMLSTLPGSAAAIAGVARNGLWSLSDSSADWQSLGIAPGSEPIDNRPINLVFDPEQPGRYWESGMYGDGVYRTDDGGVTFARLGDVQHVDGVAVDMTDPARQTLLATIHERPDVWLSDDGGASWRSIAETLPENVGGGGMPYVLDSSTFLLGTWSTEQPWIYRSTDRGQTWEPVFAGTVLELSYPLVLPDESMLWVLNFGAGVVRSTDRGATWETWSDAPLVTPLREMGDGRLAAATADQVMISDDDGATWIGVGPNVPFRPWGFAYVAGQQTFYISHWDCGDIVLPDAIAALSLS